MSVHKPAPLADLPSDAGPTRLVLEPSLATPANDGCISPADIGGNRKLGLLDIDLSFARLLSIDTVVNAMQTTVVQEYLAGLHARVARRARVGDEDERLDFAGDVVLDTVEGMARTVRAKLGALDWKSIVAACELLPDGAAIARSLGMGDLGAYVVGIGSNKAKDQIRRRVQHRRVIRASDDGFNVEHPARDRSAEEHCDVARLHREANLAAQSLDESTCEELCRSVDDARDEWSRDTSAMSGAARARRKRAHERLFGAVIDDRARRRRTRRAAFLAARSARERAGRQ